MAGNEVDLKKLKGVSLKSQQ